MMTHTGPVVLMTWGHGPEEARPRRPFLAVHSSLPPVPGLSEQDSRPRRLGCCQILLAVIGLLLFYVVVLLAILYATDSVDTLYSGTERRSAGRHDVDIAQIRFIHQPQTVCQNDVRPPYFAVFVHSDPAHVRHRRVIRQTWGSVPEVDGDPVRVVFVFGKRDHLQPLVDAEARQHGDIVQAEFDDSYRNLTVKHLLGYRWMLQNCDRANFLVKADDDAFLDIYQLVRFVRRVHGSEAPGALICNVLPAGTPVQRTGKWTVDTSEYSAAEYPRFCGGLLYLTTPDTAAAIYRHAVQPNSRRLWVDDVYVTGIAAAEVGAVHYYMNLRYTYDTDEFTKWLSEGQDRPFQYMVGHMDTETEQWEATAYKLWEKTRTTSRKVLS